MPSIRVLKVIVGVLGVVIVLALAAVVYGVAVRFGRPATSVAPAVTAAAPWDTLRLGEPAGTRISAASQSGSLLVLHLYTGNPGTDERVVVVDVASGRVVGRIAVTEPR